MTLKTAVNSRSRRLACVTVLVLMAAGLAALVWAAFTPSKARVGYNASDSVPIGWYHITPLGTDVDAIPVDSVVLGGVPDGVAVLADQRGYRRLNVSLLNRVGAAAPQHVCVEDGRVRIDGVTVAHVLLIDAQARPLPSWTQCRQLVEGELFLLSTTNPGSFDSRYFGPIDRANVIGVAHRLDLE